MKSPVLILLTKEKNYWQFLEKNMNKEQKQALKEVRENKKEAKFFFWMFIIILIVCIIYSVSRYYSLYQISRLLRQNPNPVDVDLNSTWVSIVSGLVLEICVIVMIIYSINFLKKTIKKLEKQEQEIIDWDF